MPTYMCERCSKTFTQKGHYAQHQKRKTPCGPEPPAIATPKMIETYKVVDLFSGAGGMTQGFVDAGYSILFGVEHDVHAAKTYSANFHHPMICADIMSLDANELKTKYGSADLVIGGPPCQGFSMAGKRDQKDPRNSLFMEYLKFVRVFEPKYFVMENVPGILTMKTASGELVKDILVSEVKKLGYSLKWEKLYAPDYGVPQKRRRVIFLGWKDGINEPFHPTPTYTKETYIPVSTVLDSREDVDSKYYHSQKMIDGFYKRLEKNRESGKGFGAQFLDVTQPCYTISARYYKDGCDALVRYSQNEIRKLTEKEASRVQTFPETFVFPVSSVQTYKQIGNAVPCLLARCIATRLLEFLHL